MAISQAAANAANSSSEASSNFARSTTEFGSITMPLVAALADAIGFDFRGHSGGSIQVNGACVITWYAQAHSLHASGATPVAAGDGAVAAITQTFAAAGIAELPVSLFGKPWIYPISDTAARTALISLKK